MIKALTIAGTDPTGGAGIQADNKVFAALGVYGLNVITAIVAQNTQGVDAVLPTHIEFIEKQFYSIINDIEIDTLKIGALINTEIIETVASLLKNHPASFIVLDTVMIAKSGHPLLSKDAIKTLYNKLLPLSSIITPNLPEAAALLETEEAQNEKEIIVQGKTLLESGCNSVLMKGGHLKSENSTDILITPYETIYFDSPRIETKNTHGTGCTLSAAITALYPKYGLTTAIQLAKEYTTEALRHSDRLNIGRGHGPTHHFHRWY